MGRRIVRISPELLQDIFTVGNTSQGVTTTVEGLPPGARFLRAWYDASLPGDGQIMMLFEHESWPETVEGALYETVNVVFWQEQPV